MRYCTYVVTVPVIVDSGIDMQNQHKRSEQELKEYLKDGYIVTHITSSVINNMFVYHWLEKEIR